MLLAVVLHRNADVGGSTATWSSVLLPPLLFCGTWALLTLGLLLLASLLPLIERGSPVRLLIAVGGRMLLAVGTAVAQLMLYAWLAVELRWPFERADMWGREGVFFVGRLYENIGIAVLLLLGDALLTRATRARAQELATARLQLQLADARLAALGMELQPHFLFNTLNSVAALVHVDAPAADRMIARLSSLLRRTLEAGREPMATLAEELEVLDMYLDIQQVRFGDRLEVVRDIDAATLEAEVPRFILQPLVENALQHGIEPRRGRGRITLEARRDGDALVLAVHDDGVGVPPGGPAREGTGLGNTRARLAHLYPGSSVMLVAPAASGGTSITLRFPFRADPAIAAPIGTAHAHPDR